MMSVAFLGGEGILDCVTGGSNFGLGVHGHALLVNFEIQNIRDTTF